MHLFFSVGEPSGDLHTAKLVGELRGRQPGLRVSALGGPLMEAAGCRLLFRTTDVSVMGILRVIPLIWKFWTLFRSVCRHFDEDRPDAVVLVDFPGFNWWIAQAAKKRGIRVFYYLPPQLWAWAPWRVRRMRKWVDHVLCCLPFEQEWFRQRGVAAEFVGHPFFDEVAERPLDQEFMAARRAERAAGKRLVAILPGSRNHEVSDNFPLQMEMMRRIHEEFPESRFLIANYKDSQRQMCIERLAAAQLDLPVELHVNRTGEIVESAEVCVMVSGSVSLELLARVTPAVVVYRISRSFHWFVKVAARIQYFSLPNLIADRMILPEFAPVGPPEPFIARMTEILTRWLRDPAARATQVAELTALRDEVATAGATARAALAILEKLGPAETRIPQRGAA